MKIALFLMLFLFGSTGKDEHDVPLATFTIDLEQRPWTISVELDREDLATALSQPKPGLPETIAYLQKHTAWIVDGKEASLDLCTFSFDYHHCIVTGQLLSSTDSPREITLLNTCLLEVEAEQTNVVYLDRADKSRGFRLHAGRTRTVVKL